MARTPGHNIQASISTNTHDIVKQALKARNYTYAKFAEILGYNGPSSITSALSGRNMQINVLAMMLDELGFDIIVKDRSNPEENTWKINIERMQKQT